MTNDIENMLSEDVHYQIIPAENDIHSWHIRLLEEYPETVISFGAIEFVGEDDDEGHLSFNFSIVSSPDPDLTIEDLTFQQFVGRILQSVIDKAVTDGTLVAQDKDGEFLATEEVIEEIKERYDEYQFGTDSSEELINE